MMFWSPYFSELLSSHSHQPEYFAKKGWLEARRKFSSFCIPLVSVPEEEAWLSQQWGFACSLPPRYSLDNVCSKFFRFITSGCSVICFLLFLKVYSWGRNDKGQLGINSTKEVYCGPSEVVFLRDTCIKDIACGSNHVLTLDGHGDLFSWGSNACRQLGSVQFEQRCFPLRLNLEIRYLNFCIYFSCEIDQ